MLTVADDQIARGMCFKEQVENAQHSLTDNTGPVAPWGVEAISRTDSNSCAWLRVSPLEDSTQVKP
jgi:hypothetical protein